MEKGALLGKGMTSEVYEWDHDKVLKLYFSTFGEEWVAHEEKVGRIIYEAGVSAPAVYDRIELDGRKGLVFERIIGKSILKHLETEPWKIYEYARELARMHCRMHKHSANGLPTQKERFSYILYRSAALLGNRIKRIMDYMDNLPDTSRVCHGDIHFNNVLVTSRGLIPVDWNSAYSGSPESDVARTCLIMSSPSMPSGTKGAAAAMSMYVKGLTYWTYLNEYIMQSKTRYENIDAWLLPVAAAKLKDKISGEQKWLMDFVDKRLEKYKL